MAYTRPKRRRNSKMYLFNLKFEIILEIAILKEEENDATYFTHLKFENHLKNLFFWRGFVINSKNEGIVL